MSDFQLDVSNSLKKITELSVDLAMLLCSTGLTKFNEHIINEAMSKLYDVEVHLIILLE